MFRNKQKKYLFEIGDEVEVHFNESGFDIFLKGKVKSFEDGVTLQYNDSLYFTPSSRILYFSKKVK